MYASLKAMAKYCARATGAIENAGGATKEETGGGACDRERVVAMTGHRALAFVFCARVSSSRVFTLCRRRTLDSSRRKPRDELSAENPLVPRLQKTAPCALVLRSSWRRASSSLRARRAPMGGLARLHPPIHDRHQSGDRTGR
jgi:hypothetical protein